MIVGYTHHDYINNYKLSNIPLSVKVRLRGYTYNYSRYTLSGYIRNNDDCKLETFPIIYANEFVKLKYYRHLNKYKYDKNRIYKIKPLSENINSDYENFYNKMRVYYNIKRR